MTQIVLKSESNYGLRSNQKTFEPTSTYLSTLIDQTSDDDAGADADNKDLRYVSTPWQLQSPSPTSPITPTLDNDMDAIDQPTFSSSDTNGTVIISDDASLQEPNSDICDGEGNTDMDISNSEEEETELDAILDLQRTLIGVLTATVHNQPREFADAWDYENDIIWMEVLDRFLNLASQRKIKHVYHYTENLYDLTFSDAFIIFI